MYWEKEANVERRLHSRLVGRASFDLQPKVLSTLFPKWDNPRRIHPWGVRMVAYQQYLDRLSVGNQHRDYALIQLVLQATSALVTSEAGANSLRDGIDKILESFFHAHRMFNPAVVRPGGSETDIEKAMRDHEERFKHGAQRFAITS